MIIDCPCCGPRPVSEFSYIGDAEAAKPDMHAPAAEWVKAVYTRTNPRGMHLEHWQHLHGCRQFLKIQRDTLTHEIFSVELAGVYASGAGE